MVKHHKRILVVEDDRGNREYIAAILASEEFDLSFAGEFQEAHRLLRLFSGGYELALIDVGLPGAMDGIDLAALIQNKYPKIKILILSGDLWNIVEENRLVEKPPMILKPYDPQTLRDRINELLQPSQ